MQAFFHDILHGVFHVEGKIWHTLPMLAIRPGRLTREYIDGRRARYLSPIALFLFVVFLTYAAYSILGSPVQEDGAGSNFIQIDNGDELARESQAETERLQNRLEREQARGRPTAGIAEELAAIEQVDEILDASQQSAGELAERINQTISDGTMPDASTDQPGWLEGILVDVQSNPKLLAYKLQANAYKYSWLLIPLSVPFMWLLFPFSRRFGLYDHTIFVTYSLSFMLFITLLSGLLGMTGITALAELPILYAPVHLFLHLRGTYGLKKRWALLRMIPLCAFALCALLIFSAALLAMATV